MKILALDIATKTGWCTETTSGTWDFTPKRGESSGMKLLRFKAKVKEAIELESIDVVSYERVAGLHKASIIANSEMVGVLKDLCLNLNVEVANYAAKEIKKFATNNGNCNKQAMVQAAIDLGYTPNDDNEADAIFLYKLTKKDLQV